MDESLQKKRWFVCICLGLALITFGIYWQVHRFDFVIYDDPGYISQNYNVMAGLNGHDIVWAFSTGEMSNWHPLTWLSLMLDCQLFGLNAGGSHIVNLLLHIANTLLLFMLLAKMTKSLWPCAFTAAVFALHPLHVESVAWIAERKDVLSTLFWMLTLIGYIHYVKSRGKTAYILSLIAFALGLLAKPMLITLPLIMLLVDYWPLDRFTVKKKGVSEISIKTRIRPLLREKIPFFILAAASCVITFIAQYSGGAVSSIEGFPISVRVSNALVAYMEYIGKMFVPIRLALPYPHPGYSLSLWYAAVCGVLLLLISAAAVRFAGKFKYFFVGWFWYVITLVPVIGLVQVGNQGMADRYTYIPLIGLFIIIAWAVRDLTARLPLRKILVTAAAAIVLAAMSISTFFQLQYWRDSTTLFEHALAVTKDNYIAHLCLANLLHDKGDQKEAMLHCKEALRIRPEFVKTQLTMGLLLADQGKLNEAVTYYQNAIKLGTDAAEAYASLASAYDQMGRFDEAITYYKKALELEPAHLSAIRNLGMTYLHQKKFAQAIEQFRKTLTLLAKNDNKKNADVHNTIGMAYAQLGNPDAAIAEFKASLEMNPNDASVHANLGHMLALLKKPDEALAELREAVRIDPNSSEANYALGSALSEKEMVEEAAQYLKKAIKLKPGWVEPANSLAWLMATRKGSSIYDPNQAIALAERACKISDNKNPAVLDTLAGAYASAGRFSEAVSTGQRALDLAQTQSMPEDLLKDIRSHLELFKADKPYIEPGGNKNE